MAKIKNWTKFQHYKNRCPPWIKLQKELLDDYEYARLPIASKALAPLLWLLASETTEGEITTDATKLAFRIRWPIDEVIAGLNPLIERGFIVDASEVLASCYQAATPEGETEAEREAEEEREKAASPPAAAFDFRADLFSRWKAMPSSGGGAFLSKLFKDYRPEQKVVEAIERTLEETRADPRAFVIGILKSRSSAPGETDNDRILAGWDNDPMSAPWAGCDMRDLG